MKPALLPLLAVPALALPALALQGAPQAPVPATPPAAAPAGAASDSPFDLSAAVRLLEVELADLDVAVILRQGDRELLRFQRGAIDFDTKTRLASLTKTVSAGVILSLVDAGELALEETLAEGLPLLFSGRPVGRPTVLDCWAMRHGIDARLPYEHLRTFGLVASVAKIASQGELAFEPGTRLAYDGAGMQATGLLATKRTGLDWEQLAHERVLDPCGMQAADYGQFGKNPAIAGGLRASAEGLMAYATVLLDQGRLGEQQLLSAAAVELLFTAHTADLPVASTPFPASHPAYPDGRAPSYGFGAWVLAQGEDGHVEELVGAGAWGSYLWLDRRRGLSAVLVTDVPAGSKRSMDAALGLFELARGAVEDAQVTNLRVEGATDERVQLSWTAPAGCSSVQVYGSDAPLLDVFDLHAATPCYRGPGTRAEVAAFTHYAVLADFAGHENTALVPGVNALAAIP